MAEPRTLFPAPAGRLADIDTPALLLNLEALEGNLQRMAAYFADRPASLRPHAKTHKCPEIARRQVAAGAIGITCAKVSEAEVMARAGIDDILIANQVVGATKLARLTELARGCDLMVAVDDPTNVAELAQACAAQGVTVRVLVEVDIGMGRCGVPPGDPALALAQQVAAAPALQLAGLMGYEGHLVLIQDPAERDRQVRQAFAHLATTRDRLERAGLPVAIVSGGATGTYDIAGDCPPVTEVQAGSYVMMDSTYLKVRPEFELALTVLATVVSRPTPGTLVVDAGLKSMTKEFGWPTPLGVPGASVRYLSEEHGVLDLADPKRVKLRPGDRIRFVPSHCCTTVNLHDVLHVVRQDELIGRWAIAGRGCAQ